MAAKVRANIDANFGPVRPPPLGGARNASHLSQLPGTGRIATLQPHSGGNLAAEDCMVSRELLRRLEGRVFFILKRPNFAVGRQRPSSRTARAYRSFSRGPLETLLLSGGEGQSIFWTTLSWTAGRTALSGNPHLGRNANLASIRPAGTTRIAGALTSGMSLSEYVGPLDGLKVSVEKNGRTRAATEF